MFRKLKEWIADHVPQVQYPAQRGRYLPKNARNKPGAIRFYYRMSWERRALIFLISLVTLMITIPMLLAMSMVIWAVGTSL